MRAALIWIRPLVPGTSTRVDVYVGDGPNADVYGTMGISWEPAIARRPSLSQELMSPEMDGRVQVGKANFEIAMAGIRSVQQPQSLFWRGAPVKIYTEAAQMDLGATPEFVGNVTSDRFDSNFAKLAIEASVSDALLDQNLLSQSFDGSTGIGGDVGKRGTLKPAGFGVAKNVEPVFFDETLNIGMIDGYGNLLSVQGLYEGRSSMGAPVADYASYATLAAAITGSSVPPGRWATSIAAGLIGLGAPPVGRITADATFGTNRPGALMRRMMETNAAISVSLLDTTAFASLDTTVNRAVHYWTAEQRSVKDLVEAISGSCNATPLVNFQGKVTVTRAIGGTNAGTLNRDGSTTPRVIDWAASESQAPYWQIKGRAARPGVVLQRSEVNYVDTLVPRGIYNTLTVYRAGNIVTLYDGSEYLYTNATAGSGNSPPNVTYWQALTPAIRNTFTVSATAPTSPINGDVWIDNSGTYVVLKVRSGGAWVTGANAVAAYSQLTGLPASLADINGTESTKLGGIATGATRNVVTYSATAPSSPIDGDLWVDTSSTFAVFKVRSSGTWQTGANALSTYNALSGRPVALADINTTESSKLAGIAAGATRNIVTYSTTAPGSPVDGDLWVDTSGTYAVFKLRSGGAWVTGANALTTYNALGGTPVSLADINTTESTKLTGIAAGATRNVVTYSSTAPGSPIDGDLWVDTSSTYAVFKVRSGGAWQTGANALSAYNALSGRPVALSDINTTESAKLAGIATGATRNTVTYAASAPGSPVDGDLWVDTSGTYAVFKLRSGGTWVTGANALTTYNSLGGTPVSLNDINTTESSKLTGIQAGATQNTYFVSASDPGGSNGSLWKDTSTTPATFRVKVAGSWVTWASYVTDTAQITDGANLGLTALWSGIAGNGRPDGYATSADNLITNADLGVDGSQWTFTSGCARYACAAGDPAPGQIGFTASAGAVATANNGAKIPLLNVPSLFITGWSKATSGSTGNLQVILEYYRADGSASTIVFQQIVSVFPASAGVWTPFSFSGTPPSDAASVVFKLYGPITGAGGYICGVRVAKTELAAQVSQVITPATLTSIVIRDVSGAAKTGEFPRDLVFKLIRGGVDVTTSASWKAVTKSGSVTATPTSGSPNATGVVNVTAASDQSRLTVTATYQGRDTTAEVFFDKNQDAPAIGGGGTGGSGTSVSTSSIAGATSTSYGTADTILANVSTGAAGTLTFSLSGSFNRTTSGTIGAYAKFRYRAVGAGTWIDVGTETASSYDASRTGSPEPSNDPGGLSISGRTQTGLTANTVYEVSLSIRNSGSGTTTWSGSMANVQGS